MPATDQEIRHVVETYAAQQASIIATVMRLLLNIWLPFQWYGKPDMVNAYAAASAVQIDVAVEHTRNLARAYMLEMLASIDASPRELPPIETLYPRSDTLITDVYKRPARQVEHKIRQEIQKALAETPGEPTEITKVLTTRLEQIVEADIAAAARDEQAKVLDAAPPEKVIGWRRVIHPELSKSGSCGLCVVASDRFYTRGDLLDIHDRCKCTVAPLTASSDPGLKLNREDLDALYAAAGSNYGEDLKRIRVRTVEHGELGPILIAEGDKWKTVGHVNSQTSRHVYTPYRRPTREVDTSNWIGMAESSRRSIRILQDAKANGSNMVDLVGNEWSRPTYVADIDKAIAYHQHLIDRSLKHRS